MNEEWKWIKGFENQYQASNLGRIKSFKANKNGTILMGNTLKDGRVRVNLNGKKYLLHRLVLMAFCPELETNENCLVLHKDGNPSNNTLENLKWGSYKENANDELMHQRCKIKVKKSKQHRKEQQNLIIEDELWKDIQGYDGDYQISNYGRVKSLKRKNPLILSPILGRTEDYYSIGLTKNGNKSHYSIDRLVAEAFIPNPNNYPEVNHIDENTKNNNANNLEWVTHSQNIKHSAYRQSYPVAQYDKNYNLIAKYESVAEASRQTGYARSNIKSAIERNGTCHGYIWKYL